MTISRNFATWTRATATLSAALVLSACATRPPVVAECPQIPAPPAAIMMPPEETNFLQRLEDVISGRDSSSSPSSPTNRRND